MNDQVCFSDGSYEYRINCYNFRCVQFRKKNYDHIRYRDVDLAYNEIHDLVIKRLHAIYLRHSRFLSIVANDLVPEFRILAEMIIFSRDKNIFPDEIIVSGTNKELTHSVYTKYFPNAKILVIMPAKNRGLKNKEFYFQTQIYQYKKLFLYLFPFYRVVVLFVTKLIALIANYPLAGLSDCAILITNRDFRSNIQIKFFDERFKTFNFGNRVLELFFIWANRYIHYPDLGVDIYDSRLRNISKIDSLIRKYFSGINNKNVKFYIDHEGLETSKVLFLSAVKELGNNVFFFSNSLHSSFPIHFYSLKFGCFLRWFEFERDTFARFGGDVRVHDYWLHTGIKLSNKEVTAVFIDTAVRWDLQVEPESYNWLVSMLMGVLRENVHMSLHWKAKEDPFRVLDQSNIELVTKFRSNNKLDLTVGRGLVGDLPISRKVLTWKTGSLAIQYASLCSWPVELFIISDLDFVDAVDEGLATMEKTSHITVHGGSLDEVENFLMLTR